MIRPPWNCVLINRWWLVWWINAKTFIVYQAGCLSDTLLVCWNFIFTCVCTCTMCMLYTESRRVHGVKSTELEWQVIVSPGCFELNSGPLKEQDLLTAEPSPALTMQICLFVFNLPNTCRNSMCCINSFPYIPHFGIIVHRVSAILSLWQKNWERQPIGGRACLGSWFCRFQPTTNNLLLDPMKVRHTTKERLHGSCSS